MQAPRRRLIGWWCAVTLGLLAGCGGDAPGTPGGGTREPVTSVQVTPTPALVEIGATVQLVARPVTGTGVAVTDRTVTWTSSDSTVASVSATGVVRGVREGVVTILAVVDGRTGSAVVSVAQPAGARCTSTTPITLGATVTGQLAVTDCQLADDSFADKYLLVLTDSTPVRIAMRSAAVDAFLFVQAESSGEVLVVNDDGGLETNALIERVFAPGRYIVVANSFAADEVGSYVLSVSRASTPCLQSTPITTAAVLSDVLGTSSCLLPDSTYARRFQLTVANTATVTILMTSPEVDSYLLLETADGSSVARNDNGGGGRNARVAVTLTPGTYALTATTGLQGGRRATGAYTLTVSGQVNNCGTQGTIAVGGVVLDTLLSSGCRLPDGTFVKRYALSVPAPTAVRIDLASTQFDPYLYLQPAGSATVLGEDDDSGPGLDAQLLRLLPTGNYVVTVGTAVPGDVGLFALTVSGSSGGAVGLTVSPPAPTLTSGGTQQLTATVTGSTNTAVAWRTDNPGIATVDATGLVRAIAPGTTTITATAAADAGVTATASVTVAASALPNLDVPLVTLTQAIQTSDGRIPLVAGRGTVARVFVRADRAGLPAVPVRLRVFHGSTLAGTVTGSASPTLAVDEGCCAAVLTIPESLLRDGMTITADADPENAVVEANEADNAWPLAGRSKPVRVVTVPPLSIRLLPVRHGAAGTPASVTTALAELLGRLFPVSQLSVVVAPPFTTELAAPLDGATQWSAMLREVETLRAVEGGSGYYYAVLPQRVSTGVIGIATLGGFAGVGISGPDAVARETLAHELGHSFGRRHSPTPSSCGAPSGVDPGFPRANGTIGFHGFDLATGVVALPARFDIMGYCDDPWVSEYTYLGVLNYLRSGAVAASTRGPSPVLLLTGTVVDGATAVEPIFTIAGAPTRGDAAGRWVAEGLAADGRVLFQHRFSARAVTDAGSADLFFQERIAVDSGTSAALARVVVRDLRAAQPPLTMARRVPAGRVATDLRLAVQDDGGLQRRALGGGRHELTWHTDRAAAVLVRDRATGRVLGIGRRGTLQFEARDLSQVEALVSDGVTSTTRVLSAVAAP